MYIVLFTDLCFQESSVAPSQASESSDKSTVKCKNKDKKEDAGKILDCWHVLHSYYGMTKSCIIFFFISFCSVLQ